jgi:hypothetical protein
MNLNSRQALYFFKIARKKIKILIFIHLGNHSSIRYKQNERFPDTAGIGLVGWGAEIYICVHMNVHMYIYVYRYVYTYKYVYIYVYILYTRFRIWKYMKPYSIYLIYPRCDLAEWITTTTDFRLSALSDFTGCRPHRDGVSQPMICEGWGLGAARPAYCCTAPGTWARPFLACLFCIQCCWQGGSVILVVPLVLLSVNMSDAEVASAFKGTVAWDFYGHFLAWMDSYRPEREPLLVFKF